MKSARTALMLTIVLVLGACGSPSTTPSPAATDGASMPAATDGGPSSAPTDSSGPIDSFVPEPGDSGDPGGPTPSEPGASPDPGESPEPTAPVEGFDPRRIELTLERVARGLTTPVFLTHAGDGSGELYVVERAGRIRVLDADGTVHPEPFLDIRNKVDTGNERGMLGLAFHPDYAENGRFFVYYSDRSGNNRVVEFSGGENGASRNSEKLVLRLNPRYDNHQGGMIAFGPDGYLYIGVGDGGGNTPGDPFGNGQKRNTLLGKILRIDVDTGGNRPYRIPDDNPFASARGEPEIWATGVRNPWRFSFDRETGNLFIGDVGQNTYEEVNLAPAGVGGLNFGWSDMEGGDCHNLRNCDPAGYTLPIAAYDHGRGCSITGGYVYRGTAQPALEGGYLFSDFCRGTIWGFAADDAAPGETVRFRRLATSSFNVVSFGEDEAGEIYLVDMGGSIQRVVAQPR